MPCPLLPGYWVSALSPSARPKHLPRRPSRTLGAWLSPWVGLWGGDGGLSMLELRACCPQRQCWLESRIWRHLCFPTPSEGSKWELLTLPSPGCGGKRPCHSGRSPESIEYSSLRQQSPTSLAPGTSFVEDSLSRDWGLGMVSGWFSMIYCSLHV